jgi:uncharacterized membrane protein YgcG
MSRLTFTFFLLASVLISCGQKINNDQDYTRKSIFDNAYMLTPDQVDSLNFLIKKLEQNVGSQIAIWTQVSLDNKNIDSLSYELFKKQGLGRKIQNDGILIFISLTDRQARIEVGQGLENIIKDEIAGRLLREDLSPKFVAEKYGLGLYIVVDKISNLISDNLELVGTRPEYLQRWDSIKSKNKKD